MRKCLVRRPPGLVCALDARVTLEGAARSGDSKSTGGAQEGAVRSEGKRLAAKRRVRREEEGLGLRVWEESAGVWEDSACDGKDGWKLVSARARREGVWRASSSHEGEESDGGTAIDSRRGSCKTVEKHRERGGAGSDEERVKSSEAVEKGWSFTNDGDGEGWGKSSWVASP